MFKNIKDLGFKGIIERLDLEKSAGEFRGAEKNESKSLSKAVVDREDISKDKFL